VGASSYGSEAAPPAYAAGGAAAPLAGKRAPPPPPGRPGAKKVETVTALYDYAAQVRLSFLLISRVCADRLHENRTKATSPSPLATRSRLSSGLNRRMTGGQGGMCRVKKGASRPTMSRKLRQHEVEQMEKSEEFCFRFLFVQFSFSSFQYFANRLSPTRCPFLLHLV
jgi:hypothetical protein